MNENEEDKKPSEGELTKPTLVRRLFGTKFGWPITLLIGAVLLYLAFDGHKTYLGQQSFLVGFLGAFLVFVAGSTGLDYSVGTLFGSRKQEVETGKEELRSMPYGCAVALLMLISGALTLGVGVYLQEETDWENLSIVMIGIGFLAILFSFQHAGQSIFDGTGRFLWKFKAGKVIVFIVMAFFGFAIIYGLYDAITEQYQDYRSYTE